MSYSLARWKEETAREWEQLGKAMSNAERLHGVIGPLTLDTMFRLCRLRTYLHSDEHVPDFCYRALSDSLELTLSLLKERYGRNTPSSKPTTDSTGR